MAKDKKKKKKDKKAGKSGAATSKAASSLKSLTQNPLVADVVAAALVATASALKDSNKARRLAEHAGDELEALSKKSAERGNAMWKLAIDIGRHALETYAGEGSPPVKRKQARRAPAKRTRSKSSSKAGRKTK